MLKSFIILKQVISFIIPYVILYAIYIQLNGEYSPGGGFQAGVIFASAIIGFNLINDPGMVYKYFPEKSLIIVGALGVLIYSGCGLFSFIYDDNYLNYGSIVKDNALLGQHIGIFVIEIGVGLNVSAIMCLIYLSLNEQ